MTGVRVAEQNGLQSETVSSARRQHQPLEQLIRATLGSMLAWTAIIRASIEAFYAATKAAAHPANLLGDFIGSGDHLPRITTLMNNYRDLPMDLADASLVVLAGELGSGKIVSTDTRDSQTHRWKNRHPFTNLLAILTAR